MINYERTNADVAQAVAHLIGSEEVTGSIPVISLNAENIPHEVGYILISEVKPLK